MKTCEYEVSFRIYQFFNNTGQVVSWHPPDSKSYNTRLIQLSYIEGGKRKRYIPDLICLIKNTILIIECKCSLVDSLGSDVEKLKAIMTLYEPSDIAKTIRNQNPNYETIEADTIIPCIGVKNINAELPSGFIIFSVGSVPITARYNPNSPKDWIDYIRNNVSSIINFS